MIFRFGDFKVDVDTEKTKEFYKSAKTISEHCPCDGCKNFEAAAELVPEKVKVFFDKLGVDIKKASEIGVPYEGLIYKGLWWYEGRYHICGRLLSSGSIYENTVRNSKERGFKLLKPYTVCKGFKIAFDDESISFLEEGFPEPVLQLHIDINLPWVI